ncbi:PTS sugar transporter subunit IIA [uncultured Ligilactobacillus sp.]|uniref:PTS sugar transporter subunit IIA n=1 Tax=uncultured Ligilactobacillus sp. TaxID=2837633 RepID=UPI00272D0A5E|nr:fructose PTS transporter subunit IIA [uncultured Ligilactobacillus sp.]
MGEKLLKEVIRKELMVIRSTSKNKAEVIQELATLLYENDFVSDINSFVDDVYLRETAGITGIGQGVAIPHGKSIAVKQTAIAIAILEETITWETLDEKPVKVVIMFAVKEEDADMTHILLLQRIAILLAHDDFIQNLIQVDNKDNLYDLLTNS